MSGVLASVETVKTFLESNYRYTLDRPAQKDPSALKDFLVDQKEGHCEYFATSMVLLLRQMGIAARIVNGFSGGKRNRFDDFIAIRQSNAHSWVEVFLPTQRCDENNECAIVGSWRTVDPTPSSEVGRRTHLSLRLCHAHSSNGISTSFANLNTQLLGSRGSRVAHTDST